MSVEHVQAVRPVEEAQQLEHLGDVRSRPVQDQAAVPAEPFRRLHDEVGTCAIQGRHVRHVDAHHAAAAAEHLLEDGSGRAVDITADAEYRIALGELEKRLLDHHPGDALTWRYGGYGSTR